MAAFSTTDRYVSFASQVATGAGDPIRVTGWPMTTFQVKAVDAGPGVDFVVTIQGTLLEDPSLGTDDDWYDLDSHTLASEGSVSTTVDNEAHAYLRANVTAWVKGEASVSYRHGERR